MGIRESEACEGAKPLQGLCRAWGSSKSLQHIKQQQPETRGGIRFLGLQGPCSSLKCNACFFLFLFACLFVVFFAFCIFVFCFCMYNYSFLRLD